MKPLFIITAFPVGGFLRESVLFLERLPLLRRIAPFKARRFAALALTSVAGAGFLHFAAAVTLRGGPFTALRRAASRAGVREFFGGQAVVRRPSASAALREEML